MLLDAGDLSSRRRSRRSSTTVPADREGQVKPELMQSVLEIATKPCADRGRGGDELRRCARMMARDRGGAGAAVRRLRHPPVRALGGPEDRRAPPLRGARRRARLHRPPGADLRHPCPRGDRRPRPGDLRRRRHPPLPAAAARAVGQLAVLARATGPGMMSSRTPVFRAFPRAGIPPHYGTWETYSNRVEQMMRGGAIEDYTYLWWDVRPHPNLGTVETRIFDQQTRARAHDRPRGADDLARAPLQRALRRREPLVEFPTELIDDNKVRAALRGMDGDADRLLPRASRCRPSRWPRAGRGAARRRRGARLRGRARRSSTTCSGQRAAAHSASFATGRRRRAVGADRLSREIAADRHQTLSRHAARSYISRRASDGRHRAQRRLQELRLGGEPVRHRVPVLRHPAAQAGAEARASRRRADRAREPPRKRRRRARRSAASASARERPRVRRRAPLRDDRGDPRPRPLLLRRPARRRPRPVHDLGASPSAAGSPTSGGTTWPRPFVYDDLGYLFVDRPRDGALRARPRAAARHRSRRRSSLVACGALGALAAPRLDDAFGDGFTLAAGGNGIALGARGRLVHAPRAPTRATDPTEELDWIAGRRRRRASCSLLPLVDDYANAWAGLVGGLVGLAAGFSADRVGRR